MGEDGKPEDQNDVMQVITSEFCKGPKKDVETSFHQAIPVSKNISDDANTWLIWEAMEEEIFEAINHINPLKAPGLDNMHATFTKIVGTLSVRIPVLWLKIF